MRAKYQMKTEKETIAELEAFIISECRTVDREARFDEMLDECYSFEKVGSIFASMSPSRVLKEVDPIAYRCGVNDYEDSENLVEIGDDYYERDEAEKAKAEFISDLESKADDLETLIEDAHEDDEANEVLNAKAELADLRAEIATCEKHSF